MIAGMSDLDRIDRELAALGSEPEKIAELLSRYGLRDRSLENVDSELLGLRDGTEPERPPNETLVDRPSFLPLGWDHQEPEPDAEPELAAPRVEVNDEITLSSPAPAIEDEPLPAVLSPAASHEPPVSEPQHSFAPPVAELAIEPTPAVIAETALSEPALAESAPRTPTTVESVAPPAAEPAAALEPAAPTFGARVSRPSRPDLQALLEKELDPREFPSSRPPPMRASRPAPPMSSFLPPVPRSSHPPTEPEAAEADFELLVDDDDIIEIDDET